MEDREEPCPLRATLGDERNDGVAIGSVERGGRLVENEKRMLAGEAARDIDALLLSSGEGRGRQAPQTLRQVQAREQACRTGACVAGVEARVPRRRRHDLERRHAWDDAEKLAHVAHDRSSRLHDRARTRGGDVDHAISVNE